MHEKTQIPLSYHIVRISLAVIYLHFGFLKFFDGVSPAEALAGQTIHLLSLKMLTPDVALVALAVLETVMGLLFLTNALPRTAFGIFLFHMAGTFTPFLVLPELAFNGTPFMPTLIGQYILKNIVFVAAVSAIFCPVIFANRTFGSLPNAIFDYGNQSQAASSPEALVMTENKSNLETNSI